MEIPRMPFPVIQNVIYRPLVPSQKTSNTVNTMHTNVGKPQVAKIRVFTSL